mmetsp:Transcript_8588/g.13290  ORF Transcript_8588/g.13290 Transcript_8588/m.13290 type:complete len:84 (-) Transcript_8588:2474-2725(-)
MALSEKPKEIIVEPLNPLDTSPVEDPVVAESVEVVDVAAIANASNPTETTNIATDASNSAVQQLEEMTQLYEYQLLINDKLNF